MINRSLIYPAEISCYSEDKAECRNSKERDALDFAVLLEDMLREGAFQEEAFALFDQLETIRSDEMRGLWKGSEIATGHPFEGLLTASGWYGKRFIDEEHVHPLVFEKRNGELYAIDPKRIPLNLPFAKIPKKVIGSAVTLARPFLKTEKSAARLRQIQYRGKVSAAMVYDKKDIIDVFRRVDASTLLCLMDIKSLQTEKTYFFVLKKT